MASLQGEVTIHLVSEKQPNAACQLAARWPRTGGRQSLAPASEPPSGSLGHASNHATVLLTMAEDPKANEDVGASHRRSAAASRAGWCSRDLRARPSRCPSNRPALLAARNVDRGPGEQVRSVVTTDRSRTHHRRGQRPRLWSPIWWDQAICPRPEPPGSSCRRCVEPTAGCRPSRSSGSSRGR